MIINVEDSIQDREGSKIYVYGLKPCPWCKHTPTLHMLYDLETWIPQIKCFNLSCRVQPFSKYVPIRKTQKSNPEIIKAKIEKVIGYWNDGNPYIAKEGIELNFGLISKQKQLAQKF